MSDLSEQLMAQYGARLAVQKRGDDDQQSYTSNLKQTLANIDEIRKDSVSSLSSPQTAFLGMLNVAEKVGVGGTAVKLYNDVIQRGRTEPITADDLTETEQKQFKTLVHAKAKESGQQSGKIDYPDYQKFAPGLDSNIIGGFRYSIADNGKVNISDTYDFNVNRAGPGLENNPFVQSLAIFANPRGLAAQIGRQVLPDTSGRGIPVRINLE